MVESMYVYRCAGCVCLLRVYGDWPSHIDVHRILLESIHVVDGTG